MANVEAHLAHRFGGEGHGLAQSHQSWSSKPFDKILAIAHGYERFIGSTEVCAIPESGGKFNWFIALHPFGRGLDESGAGIAHWIILSASEVTE